MYSKLRRLEPIMLLKLHLSSAPKSSLLCSSGKCEIYVIYCQIHAVHIYYVILIKQPLYIHSNFSLVCPPKCPILCEKCALPKKFAYYADIMLDPFAILLCSKLCWHNWLKPTVDYYCIRILCIV